MWKRFEDRKYDNVALFAFVAERHVFHLRHNQSGFCRERVDTRAKRYRYRLNHRE
jgi:hypothetical protein